jgi:hypothetical protein
LLISQYDGNKVVSPYDMQPFPLGFPSSTRLTFDQLPAINALVLGHFMRV